MVIRTYLHKTELWISILIWIDISYIKSECFLLPVVKEKYFFARRLEKKKKVKQRKDIVLECTLSDAQGQVTWSKNGEPVEVSLHQSQLIIQLRSDYLWHPIWAPSTLLAQFWGSIDVCQTIWSNPSSQFTSQKLAQRYEKMHFAADFLDIAATETIHVCCKLYFDPLFHYKSNNVVSSALNPSIQNLSCVVSHS